MRNNLEKRHKIVKLIRDELDENGFWEVETQVCDRKQATMNNRPLPQPPLVSISFPGQSHPFLLLKVA
jgi:hypothetical protein